MIKDVIIGIDEFILYPNEIVHIDREKNITLFNKYFGNPLLAKKSYEKLVMAYFYLEFEKNN